MGYSNETTHYGIPLPTGSDLTTPMDYNESMTDVDVAVFEAKTDSDSALTKAGQLEVALGETNDAVSAIDGRLTEAEGTITSQGLAITNLGLQAGDIRQDLEDAICSVVEESATAEYDHEVGEYFWYNNTLYITTIGITAGDTIVPNTNCDTTNVVTEISEVKTALDGLGKALWTGSVNEAKTTNVDLSGYNLFAVTYKAVGTNVNFTNVVVKGSTHMLNAINQHGVDIVDFSCRTITISDTGFVTGVGAFAKVSPPTQTDLEGLTITAIRGIV